MINRRLWRLTCLSLVVAALLAQDSRVFRRAVIAGVTLQELVIVEVARQVIAQVGREATDRIRADVYDTRGRMITEAVQPLIAEAVTKAVQATDPYGQPKGEPTTLREIIVQAATSQLTQPTSERYGSPRETVVQRIIREEVEGVVKRELKQAVDAAKAEVAAAVQTQAAAVITETITRLR